MLLLLGELTLYKYQTCKPFQFILIVNALGSENITLAYFLQFRASYLMIGPMIVALLQINKTIETNPVIRFSYDK